MWVWEGQAQLFRSIAPKTETRHSWVLTNVRVSGEIFDGSIVRLARVRLVLLMAVWLHNQTNLTSKPDYKIRLIFLQIRNYPVEYFVLIL